MWLFFPSLQTWSMRVRILSRPDHLDIGFADDQDVALQAAVQVPAKLRHYPGCFVAGSLGWTPGLGWRAHVVLDGQGLDLVALPGVHPFPSRALSGWPFPDGGEAWLDRVLADPAGLSLAVDVMES